MSSVSAKQIEALAGRLREAEVTGMPCDPVRNDLPENDVESAYAVQEANTQYWTGRGDGGWSDDGGSVCLPLDRPRPQPCTDSGSRSVWQ